MSKFSFDIEGLRRVLAKLPSAVDVEMRKAFRAHGAFFEGYMKAKRFRGYAGPKNSGVLLQNRSGLLRKSFSHTVGGGLGQGQPLTLLVFSQGTKYARLQEYGGTITPKRARNLTIPLSDNLTGAGVARYPSARDLLSRYPKQVHFLTTKKGKTFIVSEGKPGRQRADPKSSDLQWLWILKKSVEVPPRLGFRDSWRSVAVTKDRVVRFNEAVKRAAARAGS